MDIFAKIKELLEKAKYMPDLPKDVFMLAVLILTAVGAFGLGRLSIQENGGAGELRITDNMAASGSVTPLHGTEISRATTTMVKESSAQGMYVGSRSGKTYHLPWCSGAKRIRDENKVWFQNKNEAEAKGYKPAGNCKGI